MPAGTQYDDDDLYDDDAQEEESNLVKNLRKQIAGLTKANGKLENQLTTFVTQQRQSALTDALTSKGLNPAAAKFYPADAEVDEATVTAWISDNADVFGPVKTVTTDDTPAPSGPGEGLTPLEQQGIVPSFVAPEDRAAFERMAAAGLTGTAGTTRDAELAAAIAGAKTPDELTAFLRSQR